MSPNQNAAEIQALYKKLYAGDASCCAEMIDLWDEAREPGCVGTPLHVAARKGQIDICKIFCDAKVNLFDEDNAGLTPLQVALKEGHEDVASYLFEKMFGGDSNKVGRFGVSNPHYIEPPQPLVQIYAALLSNVDFEKIGKEDKDKEKVFHALSRDAISAYGKLIMALNK